VGILIAAFLFFVKVSLGHAIAQAVTRRPPTVVARVRAQVRTCRISGGQSGTGAGFLRVFRFPLPILIPLTAPYSLSIILGWYNRPISGTRAKWIQSPPHQERYLVFIPTTAIGISSLFLKHVT
jgi:hypothetical protein